MFEENDNGSVTQPSDSPIFLFVILSTQFYPVWKNRKIIVLNFEWVAQYNIVVLT